MGVGALALSGASLVSSIKAGKEAKKARRAQERIRQTQSARERLSQIRQARIAQAQIMQSGANTEGTSSTTQGAYSGVGSSAIGNIQFINQMDSLQQEVFRRMQRADLYSRQTSAYAGAANLASQAASLAMGQPTQSTAPTMSTGAKAGAQSSTVGNASSTTSRFNQPLPPNPFG